MSDAWKWALGLLPGPPPQEALDIERGRRSSYAPSAYQCPECYHWCERFEGEKRVCYLCHTCNTFTSWRYSA